MSKTDYYLTLHEAQSKLIATEREYAEALENNDLSPTKREHYRGIIFGLRMADALYQRVNDADR